MKKTVINIILILTGFLIYYLQANFFTWFTISGIMPNLYVILVLFIGLFANRAMGTIYGIGIGILLDLVIGKQVGIYAITLGIVGFLAGTFDKNFSKDSRMTIMFMVLGVTIIFEILNYAFNSILFSTNIEWFNFVVILVIEAIYNMILTIIIYPLLQKSGYYIEDEYKGNKILTRYF